VFIGELEMIEREMNQLLMALDEHKRVLKQLQPLSPERRAMQNVAGVLVPRTVAEASRELEQRHGMIVAQLADVQQVHKQKADALRAFMAENNLRLTSDQQFAPADQADSAAAPSSSSSSSSSKA
jgi:flagellar biosynthesis/type III secretory pathway chaperone